MVDGEMPPLQDKDAEEAEIVRQGAALRAQNRHAEAIELFRAVQKRRPDDALPLVGAAIALLALDDAKAALAVACEASQRAPKPPHAHFAHGQAFAALGLDDQAEKAFATAAQLQPLWAEAWVNYGVALYRQGRIEDARLAMVRALAADPRNAAAAAYLASLAGLDAAADPSQSIPLHGEAGNARAARPAPTKTHLKAWTPEDKRVALGLSVDYLSRKAVFANLLFGRWSRTLAHQVARGHQLFIVDGEGRIQGFLGWALTQRSLAEDWLQGRKALKDEECRAGDCVIVNVWAVETREAAHVMRDAMRRLFAGKHTIYFKRYYADGRIRPVRLSVNDFVGRHLARQGV
jgi:tetratricopeptide (TPR) repeat protein